MLFFTSLGVSGRCPGAMTPYNATPRKAATTPNANGPAQRSRVRNRRLVRESRRDRDGFTGGTDSSCRSVMREWSPVRTAT